MAQMADHSRHSYPAPQEYPGYGQQHSPPPPRHDAPRDDGRGTYPPPPDPNRQGQYPPAPYPPPQQWAGQPQGQPPYQQPPSHGHGHSHYPPPQYHYPPPPPQSGQPPGPHDPYRLPPPPMSYGYYPPPYAAQPAPAPRQRTAIACKYCRKRKIRCSGYDSSPDGRCQNCVRFNQTCLFHPVSSQAAFVPASALYAANGGRPPGPDGQPGQNGQPPMLYGAHGQPLGPAGPGGQPQYSYPAPPPNGQQPPPQPHYPPAPYHAYPPPPAGYGQGPPPHYDHGAAQGPPPPTASSDRSDRGSLKRGPPDDDGPDSNGTANSPRPSAKARHSMVYDGRQNGSYEYQGPTSPATSTMSFQSYPQSQSYGSTHQQQVKGNNSPPAGLTPNSIHSLNSPRSATMENRTPPPMSGSNNSSQNGQNGRNSMKVHEMLSNPNQHHSSHELRGKNDNDMLSKLDGKK